MKLAFQKYHGTGNDFILIDNRAGKIHLSPDGISRLCDRHFGIGADGLMLLTTHPEHDFGMVYVNSDGRESTMCGNGGRCITAFARRLGIIGKSARFLAVDGEHHAEILAEEGRVMQVRLKMGDVSMANSSFVIRHSSYIINTGSPHLVFFVENAEQVDVVTEGRRWRNDPEFASKGINVDFIQVKGDGSLYVRTYERGVESETLSCGTGVTAAALAYTMKRNAESGVRDPGSPIPAPRCRIRIDTPGGQLTVSFRQEGDRFTGIWLEGAAEFVFGGEIDVKGTGHEGRGMKDEGRGTRDEGRRTRDEGRRTRDEGRGMRDDERQCE